MEHAPQATHYSDRLPDRERRLLEERAPADPLFDGEEADAVLTVEEAAALLKVNRKTVLEALARQQIPGRRIGRLWRLSRSALLQSLAASTRPGGRESK